MELAIRNGKGVFLSPNGAVFKGIWLNNDFCSGEIVFPNGEKHQGQFESDLLHGIGKKMYTNSEGEVITETGEYFKGNLVCGVINSSSGYSLDGTFSDNKLQGQGRIADVQAEKVGRCG
jgi:hypothetical protein